MKLTLNCLFILLILCSSTLAAQEPREVIVKTEVSEATVFINGAQVLRKKSIDLLAGKSKIRVTDLSPYIDAKSVQARMDGSVMVTSVNHETNYAEVVRKLSDEKQAELGTRFETIAKNLQIEKANKEVVFEELKFLEENKKIGGLNTGTSLLALKEAANYYRERITALKMRDIELTKKIKDIEYEQQQLVRESNQAGGSTEKPKAKGEVVIEVECKQATRVNLELTYYVKNAGWYPSYDIRATNVDQPIDLIYKANVQQNTKEDWKNVKLKISSADPNQGSVAPQLKPYYLNYHIAPPRYNVDATNNEVTGIVVDNNNEPLIGVAVNFRGTSIGTVTNTEGRFSLAIPQNSSVITFAYLGFVEQSLPVSKSFITVRMQEAVNNLDELVVIGYGSQKKQTLTGSVALEGKNAGFSTAKPAAAKREDIAMPTVQVENQTAVEFEIKIPYTIKSDNKNTVIEVERYELPAEYEYFCIPKVTKDAFLLANIVDWEKYNLMEGEANIFFENTYIGKTILDTRYVTDTLNISLGRDKNVLVSRDKMKDSSTKKFLGSKKEDSRAWKINVRNNKSQAINFTILDQVPVSTSSEIEVETEQLSGAIFNAETGEVKWNLKLKPSDKKELELRYKVKYPKNRTLTVE